MSSQSEMLRAGLNQVTSGFEDAVSSLESARRSADEALDHFTMLGGAADRAQLVIDLIDELHREADGLDPLADEAGTAIDGVDHATTPEANIAQLETVVERVTTTKDATAAVVLASDDAIDETHGHLAGSSRADDIAGQIEEARDELEQSRTDLDGLAEEAKAQQEAYRGN
jgi:hypothetical protein